MIKKIRLKITQKEKIKPFLGCLLITVVFWMVQTLSDTYEYEKLYPIEFSGYDKQKYSFIMADTVINLSVKSTGFQYITGLFDKKEKITFDVNNENYYETGENRVYALSLRDNKDAIREQIIFLRQKEMQFHTDTVRIVLAQRTAKKIKLEVENVDFLFEPQYGLYGKPKITPDSIEIYGSEKSLEKITKIETARQTIRKINKTGFYNLKLKSPADKYPDVQLSTNYVKIHLPIEKYTEMSVVVPLDLKAQDTSLQVRLYPESAEILLDVALKDYKTINEDMFAAEVRYDGDVTKNMLPVQISKFPSNVRIKKIKPEQIQYVIIK